MLILLVKRGFYTLVKGPPRGYGGPPYGAGAPGGPQQPPGAYGPPGSYPPRYPPGPPGAPNSRPPFSPHQGYERGGSPQPTHPQGAPSPGSAQSAPGGLSPNHESHPSHMPPGSQPHQGYPPPPRPGQPSTPNAHDQDSRKFLVSLRWGSDSGYLFTQRQLNDGSKENITRPRDERGALRMSLQCYSLVSQTQLHPKDALKCLKYFSTSLIFD
ncbi:unnamed protein product [Pieris macdunnoughi]|uniref:Uncharacterized protein n=1 Tax=Pieris macdunnoughi TaxID=345717 RepID=A0A821TXH8_9NEOP|nr:unnamed protein product [Pieris macdunnoughi]